MTVDTLKIAMVDDDPAVLEATTQWLELSGLTVNAWSDPAKALLEIDDQYPGVVVSDIRMPNMDGLSFMDALHKKSPQLPVILLTGQGDIPMAVDAMRRGAWDFIEKPFDPERLEEVIRRALMTRQLQLENAALKEQTEDSLARILMGNSGSIQQLRHHIRRLACTQTHVLIRGETGAGKEVVARCIHEASTRREKPFVAINCGALAKDLIESELFGHQKGAFTGAIEKREGKLELASGGTLFLDEIESMPMDAQIKLLRVIQEQQLERVGSNTLIQVDLRIVAATKVDLLELSAKGAFREDLYYRLAIAELSIPPLRDRKEDIMLLFRHFVRQTCDVHGVELHEPDSAYVRQLLQNVWRGNVRELRNVAMRFALGLYHQDEVAQGEEGGLADLVAAYERILISQSLVRHQGNIQAVMDELKLPRRTLNQKMLRHGLRREAVCSDDGSFS
ncbi:MULTISPECIES: sigma-54-dependent transcriptional regulator [Nitrincola]|uniref:C4-dicarboxylate transport transcriptional regulatory protein dctD n=1 Tax=Nitrincola nitratireducens TaxID=1229521 RepID=W9V0H9_9GAMM|nr:MULTISPECIES: sigma-54 dependent transcriptional regulator [Nitrincola]EXJ12819.1 C4-dicarboxylate transport transcriptional regulatory protein dctD [Nitrincola nitratireducens]